MKLRNFLPITVALNLGAILSAQDREEAPPAPFIEGTVAGSAGGAIVNGDKAAFEERHQRQAGGAFGLEELRFAREANGSSLRFESRLLPVDGDYRLTGRWTPRDAVYVDFGYNRFRTFYDGSGKYFRPTAVFFTPDDERLHVDRERLWLELGFEPEDLPRLRLRYERLTRKGKKPSTALGETTFTGGLGPRSIVPAFWELDETRDILSADARFEADAYQWAAGLRYEHTEMDNARQNRRSPGEPAERAVTARDGTSSDMFSAHAFAERHFGEKLTASAAGLASTLDTNLEGSRIYGPDYDPIFDPAFVRAPFDPGLLDLAGGTRLKQYVASLNAVYSLSKHWSLRPSVRYEHLQSDNLATYVQTMTLPGGALQQQSLAAQTASNEDRLSERLEVRYVPRPTLTFSFRGEWTQAMGDLDERQVDVATHAATLDRLTDSTRLSQKYVIAGNWYVRPGLTFASEYYYKRRSADYDSPSDSTPAGSNDRYPAFIRKQAFDTHDVNVRVSWRPASMLSFVTRYDLQYSTNEMQGDGLETVRSARATTHIVSQSATWSPVPRLYLTGSANVVFDQLATPAASLVLNSDNNYVNASLGAGYAVSKRSDLYLDASHYRARDFSDNSAVSLPYGADQKYQAVSLTWVLRATDSLTYTFKYGYVTNRDEGTGGINDYDATILYAKAQYRF
ncbi:MAG TPA: hypothetical protein VGD81_11360 [Opitutaceae bacterium]